MSNTLGVYHCAAVDRDRRRSASERQVGLLPALGQLVGVGSLVCVLSACLAPQAHAEAGTLLPWIAATDGQGILQTAEIHLPAGYAIGYPNRLTLQIGFSTEEIAAPGDFFDSLTVRLAPLDPLPGATLLTWDVFGLVLAPDVPGDLALDPSNFTIHAVSPLVPPLPQATVSLAYQVDIDLPNELGGQPLIARFDLFDSGDILSSQAYVQVLVVPEPRALALLLLGGGIGLWAIRRRSV